MLDVQEQGAPIGRPGGAGDLAVHRAHQETPHLAGGHITGQHLVVAQGLVHALLEADGPHIGLDPQHPTRVEGHTVRAREGVAPDVAAGIGVGGLRQPSQHQVVPDEGLAVKVAALLPADDLAHFVLGPRVGRIHTGVARRAARGVVGQRAVDPAAALINGQPLGPVHLGGAQQVAGLAGLDHHFALVLEAVGGGQGALAVHQGQPAAGAIGLKAGHIQRAVVQQLAVGLSGRQTMPCGLDAVAADELVDVLKTGVLSGIHHRTAFARGGHPCTLVGSTAQGGALDRCAGGVHGVELHDPAEAVGFVGVQGRVESFVVFVPPVPAAIGANAPAPFVFAGLRRAPEVACPVLFA